MSASVSGNLGRSLLVGLIVAATALIAFLPLFYAGNDSVESTTNDVRKGIIERSADNVDAFFARARESANSVSRATKSGLLDFQSMHANNGTDTIINYLHATIAAANTTINNAYISTTDDNGCWSINVDNRQNNGVGTLTVVRRYNCTDWELFLYNIVTPDEAQFNRSRVRLTFPFNNPAIRDEDKPALAGPHWYEPRFSAGSVSLNYGAPVFNSTHSVYGIFGIAALPKDLSTFLSAIGLRAGGRAMILQAPNGTMIANSWNQPNVVVTGRGRNGEQVGDLVDFQNITDALMRRVIEHYGRAQFLTGAVPFAATMGKGRDRTYVDVLGVTDAYGLNLRILVAMPLEDFLGDFNRATTTVIAVIVPIVALILLLAVAVAAMSQYALLRRNKLAPKAAPLTLLFTDIEGSTTLWNQSPEAMGKAIDIHHRTIREVIAAHGAYEVKTVGDAFMIATESALTATTLALDIQAELAKQQWPGELTADAGSREWNGLRVRISVHRCLDVEAKYDEDKHYWDYYGNDVNIAARIESKAAGGQILMAESTWEAVKDDPRSNVVSVASWMPFAKEVYLKGVDRPVNLFSLVPVELAARAFQPLPGHEFDFEEAIEIDAQSGHSGSDTSSHMMSNSGAVSNGTAHGASAVLYALAVHMTDGGVEQLISLLTHELQVQPHKNQRKALGMIAKDIAKRIDIQQNIMSRRKSHNDMRRGSQSVELIAHQHPNMPEHEGETAAASGKRSEQYLALP